MIEKNGLISPKYYAKIFNFYGGIALYIMEQIAGGKIARQMKAMGEKPQQ